MPKVEDENYDKLKNICDLLLYEYISTMLIPINLRD